MHHLVSPIVTLTIVMTTPTNNNAKPIMLISTNIHIHSNHEGITNDIDWDDEQSVSTIVDDIHVQLEAALKSSVEEYDNSNDAYDTNNGVKIETKPTTSKSLPTRFIRKITIVRGRGF